MKISTKFDFIKIPSHKRFNARLMISIHSERSLNKISKPLNLALVLDRSGSMSGQKLQYVKEATKILTNRMGNDDIFSLTIFNSRVEPLIPPVKVDQANGIEETIDIITARDTTNLSGGYQQGFDYAKKNKTDKNITRVMLLTDGLANRGITDPGQLANIARDMQVRGISTTTIGVGKDYNEFLLGRMAENGGGGAYFIENPDDAPGVFEEELGNLQSLVASDFELKILPANENIRFNQLNTYRISEGNSYLLGDVYGGQTKSLILELELPEMEVGQGVEIGVIEASYYDAIGKEPGIKTLKIPVKIDIVNEEEFLKITPDKDVITASAYLAVARGKIEAIELADRGDYEGAANRLERYADDIEELKEKYKLDSPRLINDIQELRERAHNLRFRREAYYSQIERKRMYHESDMLMKNKLSSYDAMMNRRPDRIRHMFTDQLILLFNKHDIRSLKGLKDAFRYNRKFISEWRIIWNEITVMDGGKVNPTTMKKIIDAVLVRAMIASEGETNGLYPFIYEEYELQYKKQKERERKEYERREKEREEQEKKEKQERDAAKRRRLEKARVVEKKTQQKAEQRKNTIRKLTAMNSEDRWNYIATNKSVNMQYYPSEWADESDQVLKELSSETRIALIERIRYERKGPWKKLHRSLSQIQKEFSNPD